MLIYDCEILRMIPARDGSRHPGYQYCNGWDDFVNMGISVIGLWAANLDDHMMTIANPDDSIPLNAAQGKLFAAIAQHNGPVIGFNSRSFDDNLCLANNIPIRTDYDLLEEIRIAAGFGPRWDSVPRGYSYKLDAIARANGLAKSGTGALAPQQWQDGDKQAVIDYCAHDVEITKLILEMGLIGRLRDPNTNQILKLRPLPQ